MTRTVFALFQDSEVAGEVVGKLKGQGFTNDISVLAKHGDQDENLKDHTVKQDVTDGATTGAVTGAIAGAAAALASGITSLVVPSVGLLVGGPLMAALGVTGGALGGLAGGLLGALVDYGIDENTAKLYEKGIAKGQILVGVTASNEEKESEITRIFEENGATEITTTNN